VSEPPVRWDIVIKVAVEAAEEAEARSIVDLVLGAMGVATAGPPPFVQFDDGTWATEIRVDDPTFEQVEPNDALSVLSCLTADLDPVTWRSVTDSPFAGGRKRLCIRRFARYCCRRAGSRYQNGFQAAGRQISLRLFRPLVRT